MAIAQKERAERREERVEGGERRLGVEDGAVGLCVCVREREMGVSCACVRRAGMEQERGEGGESEGEEGARTLRSCTMKSASLALCSSGVSCMSEAQGTGMSVEESSASSMAVRAEGGREERERQVRWSARQGLRGRLLLRLFARLFAACC